MEKFDKTILDEYFPKIESDSRGRYAKDDIKQVLEFMKNHPAVQVTDIAKYSGISLGTLVSWRKKYGKYFNIKVKGIKEGADSNNIFKTQSIFNDTEDQMVNLGKSLNSGIEIPLSLINELVKLNTMGASANIAFNNLNISVNGNNLTIKVKSGSK